jgi:hypothetical protein
MAIASAVIKHKNTSNQGTSKAYELRLDASPGEMYMATWPRNKLWPVIICDEEMLPELLLSKRPVSAKCTGDKHHEDVLEGGKYAKNLWYPILFLGTNEL